VAKVGRVGAGLHCPPDNLHCPSAAIVALQSVSSTSAHVGGAASALAASPQVFFLYLVSLAHLADAGKFGVASAAAKPHAIAKFAPGTLAVRNVVTSPHADTVKVLNSQSAPF